MNVKVETRQNAVLLKKKKKMKNMNIQTIKSL